MLPDRPATWWRWLLVPIASAAAFLGVLYFNLFAIMLGPFPRDLADPTAGALAGLLIVLSGALVAPRRRPLVAVALAVVVIVMNGRFLLFWQSPVAMASACAVAFLVWLDSPRRTAPATRRAKIAGWAGAFLFLGLIAARYIDVPALADAAPRELEGLSGATGSQAPVIYVYDLGGFIDHEWLWRVDADADTVARLASSLALQPVTEVPRRFWAMPPFYWPRAMPVEAMAFSSPAFDGTDRGPDGPHYFLVYDKSQRRAYVWYKSNF